MQGSDREGGELPLLEGAFLSGFVRLLYQCTWLCRRGIKIPKRYHERGKLLEEWPGDDSGAALIQIDLWMSMLRLGNKLCARASLRRQRQHFALCVPAFFFCTAPNWRRWMFFSRRDGGETERRRGAGQHSTWRKEEYTDHTRAFFYGMVSCGRDRAWKLQPLFFLDYKVGKHFVHSAFISFLQRQ